VAESTQWQEVLGKLALDQLDQGAPVALRRRPGGHGRVRRPRPTQAIVLKAYQTGALPPLDQRIAETWMGLGRDASVKRVALAEGLHTCTVSRAMDRIVFVGSAVQEGRAAPARRHAASAAVREAARLERRGAALHLAGQWADPEELALALDLFRARPPGLESWAPVLGSLLETDARTRRAAFYGLALALMRRAGSLPRAARGRIFRRTPAQAAALLVDDGAHDPAATDLAELQRKMDRAVERRHLALRARAAAREIRGLLKSWHVQRAIVRQTARDLYLIFRP